MLLNKADRENLQARRKKREENRDLAERAKPILSRVLLDDDGPKELHCPITCEIMHNPHIADDGHTYEFTAIERWFALHSTSPVTNTVLRTKKLIPNYAIKSLIAKFTEARNEEMARNGEIARKRLQASLSSSELSSCTPQPPYRRRLVHKYRGPK